jgi:hypothetical protein
MHFHAHFPARRVARMLLAAFGFLLLMHLLVQFGHLVMGWPMGAMTLLFDMDLENNMPAFFNAGLFFFGAALFYLAGRSEERRQRRPWYLLALVFLFLGIDEGSQVHEQFMIVTLKLIGWNKHHMGWLYYAWTIPYGLAAIALGIVLLRFMLKLHAITRKRLVLSGAIYIAGAVVCEMWSGKIAEAANDTDLPYNIAYSMVITLEESLEMLGLILCIDALMRVHAARATALTFSVTPVEEEVHARRQMATADLEA